MLSAPWVLDSMIASLSEQSALQAPSFVSAVLVTARSVEPETAGLASTKSANTSAAPTAASATSAVPKPRVLIEILNDLLLSRTPRLSLGLALHPGLVDPTPPDFMLLA